MPPLSEVHRSATKEKLEKTQSKMSNYSSDLSSFMPDNEFVELLWENGQIVMQGQSNRPRKSLAPISVSAHKGKAQENDGRPRIAQFGALDSMVNDLLPTVPSGIGPQDDVMNPWMNYPIEDALQNDYCSEFLSEFSGVDLNSLAGNNTNIPADRSTVFSLAKDSENLEHGHASRGFTGSLEPGRVKTSQLFHLPQQSQSVTPSSKLRAAEFSNYGSSSTHRAPSGDFLNSRSQEQESSGSKTPQPTTGIGVMNFSHFSRPVALAKANLQSADRLRSNQKASTAGSGNPVDSTLINSSSGLRSVSAYQGKSASILNDLVMRSSIKPTWDGPSIQQYEATHLEDASRNNDNCTIAKNPVFAASTALGRHDGKASEAVVASSVCSGNGAAAASSDPKPGAKRKNCEVEEAEYQSEDVEDESVGVKKSPPARSTNAKRNRAAEVHNLSERKRRDRINERMRALQELIPNCNKVDKASMLDEAIEYLKTLQLQVQIMSMGSGLCMPPMMLPPGMQHIQAPPMAHYSPMSIGMGMGMGMGYGMGMVDMNGSPGCPLIPVPPLHGPQFPCSSVPGGPGLHGMPGPTSLQMFGIPGQGLPVSMPRPSQYTSFPQLAVKLNTESEISAAATSSVPLPAAESAPSSSHKDQQHQTVNLETQEKASTDDSWIQMSIQGSKECTEKSSTGQISDCTLPITGNATVSSIRMNGIGTT